MSVRCESNAKADNAVREIKKTIGASIGEPSVHRTLDQMVRLASKAGYSIVVTCVKVGP